MLVSLARPQPLHLPSLLRFIPTTTSAIWPWIHRFPRWLVRTWPIRLAAGPHRRTIASSPISRHITIRNHTNSRRRIIKNNGGKHVAKSFYFWFFFQVFIFSPFIFQNLKKNVKFFFSFFRVWTRLVCVRFFIFALMLSPFLTVQCMIGLISCSLFSLLHWKWRLALLVPCLGGGEGDSLLFFSSRFPVIVLVLNCNRHHYYFLLLCILVLLRF